MKKLLLLSTLASSLLFAEADRIEISPMLGFNFTESNTGINAYENSDLGISNTGYFIGALETQFNYNDSDLAPEISLAYAPSIPYRKPRGENAWGLRLAVNAVYSFADYTSKTVPFVKAGVGYEKVYKNEIPDNQDSPFADLGAGVKYYVMDNMALKAEAIYIAKPINNKDNNIDNHLQLLAGLSFAFGGATSEEPKVVPVTSVDDDNDGVTNDVDQCVHTPAGAKVDATGCQVDTDRDGVYDSEDKCPNSQLGEEVDASGCPVKEDTDQDGIFDNQDKCPNTIKGAKVDANGCSVDKDQDGVLNSADICPNTPLGAEVNDEGCPKEVTLNVHFTSNSIKIHDYSAATIDIYATFLKSYTNYSAEIVGYTDSTGSAAYNQKLSEKRAEAVVNALKAKGVDGSQLSYKGMGESNPVATNKTKEGRAKNRRIEAHLTRH